MSISKTLIIAIFLIACGKTEKTNRQKTQPVDNPNQALYEQVMDVHDEVMPKSDQLYLFKKQLQEKLKEEKLSDETRQLFSETINELDSADKAMRDWMHHFDPQPDSADREAARDYLEDEMEKIKKVRDLTNSVLQKAKEELGKK